MHAHVGAELAAGDNRMPCRRGGENPLVEAPAELGPGRAREAGARSARRVGRERELADDEKTAADGREIEVHLAGCVGKDAQLQHLVDELVGDRFGVLRLGADEDEQAASDGSDRRSGDLDARFDDALQQCDQRVSSTLLKYASMFEGRSWIEARRPSISLISACSTSPRRAAARPSVQVAGTCMCTSRKRRRPARRVTMSSKRMQGSAKRASVRSMRACTSGSTALSISPSTERQTTRAPSRMM